MKRILISLGILLSISIAVGVIFSGHTWFGFFRFFVLALIVQFIIHYLFNKYLELKYNVQLTQLESQLASESIRNRRDMACPCYLKNIQSIDIDLQKETRYSCAKCNKEIVVILDASTALATTPVENKAVINLLPPTP